MSNQYAIPCECGQSVVVGISQAGQQVTCGCGRAIAVPSLRALRQMPPVTTASEPRAGAEWNASKGALFAVGALLILGGLLTAGYSYMVSSQMAQFKPSDIDLDHSLDTIDTMSASDMWDAWHFVSEHGLEQAGTSPFAVAQGMADDKRRHALIGLATAAAGLVVVIVALVLPARAPRPGPVRVPRAG